MFCMISNHEILYLFENYVYFWRPRALQLKQQTVYMMNHHGTL